MNRIVEGGCYQFIWFLPKPERPKAVVEERDDLARLEEALERLKRLLPKPEPPDEVA